MRLVSATPGDGPSGAPAGAWVEELRRRFAIPGFSRRHLAWREEAEAFLAEDAGGAAAAFRVRDGCLFEMAAAWTTDTERVAAAFWRLVEERGVRSLLCRSDDPWLLPFALEDRPLASATLRWRMGWPRAGPLPPAAADWEWTEGEAGAPVLALEPAARRGTFLEWEAQAVLPEALRRAGFFTAVLVLEVPIQPARARRPPA